MHNVKKFLKNNWTVESVFKYSQVEFSDGGTTLEMNLVFLHGKSIWLGLK